MNNKNTSLNKGIFQAFIFNIITFIWLFSLWFGYFYPEFFEIENKKNQLTEIQKKYTELKTKWLDYKSFTELHSSLWKKEWLGNNIYLSNILKEFTKDDYDKSFINNKWWNYENFIEIKRKEVKIEKDKLEDSWLSDNIKNILPYYTDDSSLSNSSLTDFKFINYIEKILNNFRLEYSNSIGVWDLIIEDSVESNSLKEKEKENQLEWKIYNFKLNLWLTGRKKNIIDFIHYLEDVWNINILEDWDVEIKEVPLSSYYLNSDWIKTKNDFINIKRYFLWEKDIYNNLVVDIESIKMKDYLDSSALPTHYSKWETFINFIKKDKNQVDEKYEVDLVLKFYVKGLPIYKIKDYIQKVSIRHKKIISFVSGGIKYWEKNKVELNYSQRMSLKKLKEYIFYLQSINKDIKELQNSKKIQEEIWNIYKKAQSYNDIFDKIEKGLDVHLKIVSEELYKKYKK